MNDPLIMNVMWAIQCSFIFQRSLCYLGAGAEGVVVMTLKLTAQIFYANSLVTPEKCREVLWSLVFVISVYSVSPVSPSFNNPLCCNAVVQMGSKGGVFTCTRANLLRTSKKKFMTAHRLTSLPSLFPYPYLPAYPTLP